MKRPKGYFLRYASEFDGEPCVMVLTRSSNRKTGKNTVQVWYMPEKVSPTEANLCGEQRSVCGTCPFQDGGCYVRLWAPLAIWKAYQAGAYEEICFDKPPHERWIRPKNVRFGAWGDPASMRFILFRRVKDWLRVRRFEAFTHAWRTCEPWWSKYAMASVEDPVSAYIAQADGWRTFRIRTAAGATLAAESRCPAQAKGMLCEDCGRCCGPRGTTKNVVVTVHGAQASRAATHIVDLL